ncbi:low-density lipoprotein receptor-related protein 6-like [Montipora foliosa]|uniref:low-density lipoprotein receptor-related protein 6-like n=1 Tax=Montipora foliosa TaxID=591990 RepID=UPI0035F1ECDC
MVSALVSSRTMKTEAIICLFCLCYNICQAYFPKLLYANRKDIRIVQKIHKNHTATETIVVDGFDDSIIAVEFFFAEGYVFWTDVILEKIKRIPVRGTTRNVEDVISLGLRKPEGLALDWVARKLYWTDCGDSDWETNRIEVANLDGTNRKVLFWKNLGLPRAIAVDPLYGFMFWTDWGDEPKIERAEMDASNRQSIIQQDIYWPNGLTIDYSARKIYWTDAKLYYIDKANYDGSGREKVFKSPAQCTLGHPFDLTLYENKIYWTDWKTRGIHSSNKNTGMRCQMISSNAYPHMGIRAFESTRQKSRPGKNPCNSTTNGGCSHLCLLNTDGRSCACPTGVRLMKDQMTCEQGPVNFLLLARKEDIRLISLDTPDFTDVVVPVFGIRHAVAIDFDPVDKFIYWSDDENLEIKRSRVDGTDVQVVVASQIKRPDGIAVDWVARNLYWTDTGTDRIEVSRLNGTARKVLISENLDQPRAIALDPSHGYMYWTDWGKNPKIERAGLDGSHRITLVNSSIAWANGIAIDFHEQKIYWADAKYDKIEVMNMDGSNRRPVLNKNFPHVFGFTSNGDRLYWTDWQKRNIESVNKHTGKDRKIVIKNLPDLMGLKAVNLSVNLGSNPCQQDNGGCSHLCLYSPTGVNCECPDGIEILADKKSCILPEAFLLFSSRENIRRISLDTNNGTVIPLVGVKGARALDFNADEMQVYWTDGTQKTISRAFLNGSHVEAIIEVDLSFPDGLAVDRIAKNLYWTDASNHRIEVSRLDGQHRKMLISKDAYEPRELVLDPVSGHMYWVNGGREPTIEIADLDGSNRRTLFKNPTPPAGLTIDSSTGLIFWADQERRVIECANLNGTNRRIVVSGLTKIFALTQFKDYIYYADLSTIYRANKTNGSDRTRIESNIDVIMDLLVFHSSRQEGWNPCAADNNVCSHLCFAKPDGTRVCSCPTHYQLLDTDKRTCEAPSVFMLLSTKTTIRRILIDSVDNLEVVLPVRDLENVLSIDYDINSHLVFWIDGGTTKSIKCAYQNGTNVKTLKINSGASPFDLAIDPYGQQLYWTDSVFNSINVYSLRNKTNMGAIFKKDDVYPRSIVLYPEKGDMYFTDENPQKKSIMRAKMGGGDEMVLFRADFPGDLAVDKQEQRLFWTDTGRKKIEFGDLTGYRMTPNTLVEKDVLRPVGLLVYGNYLYWIDKASSNVMKIKKSDRSGQTLDVQAEVNDLSDIAIVDTLKTTDRHPCNKNKCTHLCLVGSGGEAQCSCPLDMILSDDNMTCGARKGCTPDQFTCSSGRCITRSSLCDGSNDCEDGSDEMGNCTKCEDGEYSCDNGQCVSTKKLCDLEPDCDDGWDEREENCGGVSTSSYLSTSLSGGVSTSSYASTSLSATTAIAVAVACLCLLFLVAVVCRWRLKQRKKEASSAPLDADFKFDAFIIYSTVDQKWVTKKLLPTLESKHKIKCCIHYRDFVPGVPFTQNMADSVYNSKKTVAVVSKSFLTSNFCSHELSIALHRLALRGDDSVVVVKLDDVKNSQLPKELRFRSYIDFTKSTDKKTWEYKLVNCLKSGTSSSHPLL